MPRKHRALRRREPLLGDILRESPEAAAVLAKHGVQVCSGCLVTLNSTPEKAAAYHAVPDPKAFARDLKRAVGRRR
ncbi:MAG: hypothetical protein HY928_16780 [Elusimicrobia bacterium]|nr:hypothetical protein [Elusimicrobiota bacterium]